MLLGLYSCKKTPIKSTGIILNSRQTFLIPLNAMSFECRLRHDGVSGLIFRTVEAKASFLLLSK